MTPAASAQPAETAPDASGIRVEHSGDGTVVYGTEKGDTEATGALKAAGFKWSRNLGGWYLPRTWGESTRELRVRQVEKTLGDRVSVERGDLRKSGTAAERAQARIDRANDLADRHTERAEKKATEADVRMGRARAIGDLIPFGQPILVGHHSEARHRRDLANIDRNMRAGFDAQGEAEQATARAESAAARARQEQDPKAAARRLERAEAELRSVDRKLNGTGKQIHGEDTAATGDYATRLQARRDELADQIAHDRSIAGDLVGGPDAPARYGKHNVKPGDVVRIRGQLHVVTGGGAKNVKVLTSVGNLSYPFSQVTGHADIAKLSTEALEKILATSGAPEAYKADARAIIAKRARG